MTAELENLPSLEAIDAELSRRSPAEFAVVASRGKWQHARHLDLLNEKLMSVAAGTIRRLIVTMPPRHGKSMLASQFFPAWYLGKYPERQIILCSYGDEFAAGWGGKARDVFKEFGSMFGLSVRDDVCSRDNWQLAGHDGSMRTGGVGGGLTGKGAHCVVAGTMVLTSMGNVRIEDLKIGPIPVKIASYAKGRIEFRDLQAVKRSEGRGIYRITCHSGRVVEATADHRFYCDGRYTKASQLSAGDPLLLAMPHSPYSSSIYSTESPAARAGSYRPLLFAGMQSKASRSQESSSVPMRESDRNNSREVVRGLPSSRKAMEGRNRIESSEDAHLYDLQQFILGDLARQEVPSLLQPVLRGSRTFAQNVGDWQSEMEEWSLAGKGSTPLRKGIPADEKIGSRAGRVQVRHLREYPSSARSSYRRKSDEQCGLKSCDALFQPSSSLAQREGFQAIADSVAMVERIHETAVVYDIQVEENHNFFANGILVHNCLIVDDPVKNAEQADSKAYREKTWEWWKSVPFTRLEPDASILILLTRWHEDDLAGRLLAEQAGEDADEAPEERWEVLNLPALAEENDALSRKPGEALWPERWPADKLEKRRKKFGPRVWFSLYQQRPLPPGGAVFQRSDFNYYTVDDSRHGHNALIRLMSRDGKEKVVRARDCRRFMTADVAASEKKSADYTVAQVWGLTLDYDLLLIDQWRVQLSIPKIVDGFIRLGREWDVDFLAVERDGIGLAAVQTLRHRGMTVKPLKARGDKISRATAAQLRFAAGMVHFPSGAPWVKELSDELESFPRAAHDDCVDATSYACQIAQHLGGAVRDQGDEEVIAEREVEREQESELVLHPGATIPANGDGHAKDPAVDAWLSEAD